MTAASRGTGVLALVLALAAAAVATATPAAADRSVGEAPLDAVIDAAETYHDDCATPANRLTVGELAGLMLAPTYPETGAPADRAPSPMTLSRYDNQSALHSYGDPTTYSKAFWHPGIGMWQWDDASLQGLPAADRIDSPFIADFTAAFIAARWCSSPSFSTVWGPWYGCNGGRCKTIYDELVDGGGNLVGLDADASVTRRGGMQAHACTLGTGESFRCWYVDPARANGFTGFAVPAFGPSPITAPFIGYRSATREHRHWLESDTGYDRDIQASLELGRNSRNDLVWASGSDLCDLNRGVGRCDPLPPKGAGLDSELVVLDILGTYVPLAGDFDGDGYDDILWYGPGDARDSLWLGRADGFMTRDVTVRGVYEPLVGDFDGDGRDDIFWYGPGADKDSRWYGTATGFKHEPIRVKGVYRPVVGDFDGDTRDDIFWYGPGSSGDSMWPGAADRDFGPRVKVQVTGTYLPFAGDFDGDGRDDVFWYGPGGDHDRLWFGRGIRGRFTSVATQVNGVYEPAVGDFDGDSRADVLWYAVGGAKDSIWKGRSNRDFGVVGNRPRVDGDYRIVTGDYDRSGRDEVFFHRPGAGYDARWVDE